MNNHTNITNSTTLVVTFSVDNIDDTHNKITKKDDTCDKHTTVTIFHKYWRLNIATREICTYVNKKILLSNCVLEGIHHLLNYVKLSNEGDLNELYCIGPTYSAKNDIHKFSDTQITVTGNLDIENSINTTLAKEMGIVTNCDSLIQVGDKFEHKTQNNNLQYVTNYALNITHCKFYTSLNNLNESNNFIKPNILGNFNDKKPKKNKFQILLFGSMDNCMSKLENITKFYQSKPNGQNKIIGLCVMKLTDIEKVINEQFQWLN